MDKKFDPTLTRAALEKFSKEELVSLSIGLCNRISSLEDRLAVSKELRLLANAEKYSPSTEQLEFLFPEIEAIYKLSDELQALGGQADEGAKTDGEKTKRKRRTPSLTVLESGENNQKMSGENNHFQSVNNNQNNMGKA